MLARTSDVNGAERIVGLRPHGSGQQYEVKWYGQEETTWEAASRVRKQIPLLVQEYEQRQMQLSQQTSQPQSQQQQQQQQRQQEGDTTDEGAPLLHAVVVPSSDSIMREQMAALEQLVREQSQQMREQSQQLQQLRASPIPSPQLSPQLSPIVSQHNPSASATLPEQSRFARKEPRSQDLREYDGAAGVKLDEWLQELALAADLYELNARETVKFAASRLRGAALQWWLALDAQERMTVTNANTLAAALRARFQPVTASRTAREQLDKLQQGSHHINDYIADFQRLRTSLPTMGEDDALYAFERGLRRDLAEKLRMQGVSTLRDAIAMAARVGGLSQVAATGSQSRAAAAHQMEVDDTGAASLDDRITRAVLNAMQAQGGVSGLGAKTQTQRGYNSERGASARGGGAARGGRGGRVGGRGGFTYTIPGVPAALVEQRRAAGQCLRCGSMEHRGMECPNAPSATQ